MDLISQFNLSKIVGTKTTSKDLGALAGKLRKSY